jgi:hypothetical protein
MSENGKKRCFVVQGFGLKTDFRTGRQLNLDDSFEIIQEAIEDAGLECIRADKVMHAGSIDVEMWEEVLNADLVVADVSTSNWNAAYELGVRHALRPRTTIVVAEDQFEFAFDINHIAIHTYKHGGPELGRSEAKRFKKHLQALIEKVMAEENGRTDSPVFLSLPGLKEPVRGPAAEAPAPSASESADAPAAEPDASVKAPTEAWGTLRDRAMEAKNDGEWEAARTFLGAAHQIVPREDYITQQLSLATRKAKQPKGDPPTDEEKAAYRAALEKSAEILQNLRPETSADPETLGLWSATHKELWFLDRDRKHLDEAIRASEKGFYLKDDYYNGINLAFLLNVRAAEPEEHEGEAIADFVRARQVRRRVMSICNHQVEGWSETAGDALTPEELAKQQDDRYWVFATLQEAAEGMGDTEGAAKSKAEAAKLEPDDWMVASTEKQLRRLGELLADSPLDRGPADTGDAGTALAQARSEATAAKAAAEGAQAALAEAQASLAATEAKAKSAQIEAQEARAAAEAARTKAAAAEARAAVAGEMPPVPAATPAAVLAVADAGESRAVQFSLIAGTVEFQVSGTDVEVTVRSR